MDALPESLLPTIAWDFAFPRYASAEQLAKAAEAVQLEALYTLDHWHPGEPAFPGSELRVQLGVGRGARSLVLQHEGGFTTLELLYALHEAVRAELKTGGRFCLLSLEKAKDEPVYVLRLATVLARKIDCVACAMARSSGTHEAPSIDWRPASSIAEDFYAA